MPKKPASHAPFQVAADDPPAAAHALVARHIEEGLAAHPEAWGKLDLKATPTGVALAKSKPAEACRYVVAAAVQARYWEQTANRVQDEKPEDQRPSAHTDPAWREAWSRRAQAMSVVAGLMRRTLPFTRDDLLALLQWYGEMKFYSPYHCPPIGALTRAVERHATAAPLDDELRDAIKPVVALLRDGNDRDGKRAASDFERLCGTGAAGDAASDAPSQPPPQPAPAGHPAVLAPLKRLLGMAPDGEFSAATVVGSDAFLLPADSPLQAEHELITALLAELEGVERYYERPLKSLAAGKAILSLDGEPLRRLILALAERYAAAIVVQVKTGDHAAWRTEHIVSQALNGLASRPLQLDREAFFDWLLYRCLRVESRPYDRFDDANDLEGMVERFEPLIAAAPVTEGERFVLSLFRATLVRGPLFGLPSGEVPQLTRLINDGALFYLVPGEAWTDALNRDLSQCAADRRRLWTELIRHAATATSSRPTAKWLKTAGRLLEAVGLQPARDALSRWFAAVPQGRSPMQVRPYVHRELGHGDMLHDENADCLRGLLWMTPLLDGGDETARDVTAVGISAFKKVPGVGPRAPKVGNAAVYALSAMHTVDALGRLALLKVRVKSGSAQKEIEKAFHAAAEALGLPRDQIEEMAVPTYGLEEVGLRRETLGDYRAELRVTGGDAVLQWFDAAGKLIKSAPAKVKSEHGDDFKELQQALKDVQAMLPAQRDRIDSLYLLEKSWPLETWRERYLDHPLVGTLAGRLIWSVDGIPALFVGGAATDVAGKPIEHGRTADVALWHPVGRSIDEVTAWRRRLESLGITQPFKQAHREVYLLTDAERRTNTYSNRFAAHILRQHQFNALCQARGWKNKLRLMVDDTYPPPTMELPQWGLRAEYRVEGIGENYGADTNESGVFLRLATDQVRFYALAAASNSAHAGGGGYTMNAGGPGADDVDVPLPLERIPPLVFSEIMRDVDLFVGVASVGNDPQWQDGGPGGRYREYWQNYSFGELSGSATTRKQVLQTLVPRLKIADRCSFSERFLVVRGNLRTYKIHLGSGNILMEPNDRYLCIVPDAKARAADGDVFLPFEGDNVLSIVLSKALLLAADDRIKDPTITRQIRDA